MDIPGGCENDGDVLHQIASLAVVLVSPFSFACTPGTNSCRLLFAYASLFAASPRKVRKNRGSENNIVHYFAYMACWTWHSQCIPINLQKTWWAYVLSHLQAFFTHMCARTHTHTHTFLPYPTCPITTDLISFIPLHIGLLFRNVSLK